MKTINITLPVADEQIKNLQFGDRVMLTGTIYTARDAAHKRMCEAIENGEELPFDIKGSAIYYAGPTPTREGQVIGSIGPTTSGRMDRYTPALLDRGLKIMIGKGERSQEVIDSIRQNKAIYLGAIGGAGALLSKCVKSCEIIAYADLGTEAVRKLYVENMPLVVINN